MLNSDMIDIAKSAVCSFLTCNDHYDWSLPVRGSAQLVLDIGLLRGVTSSLMGYVGYTCIRIMG